MLNDGYLAVNVNVSWGGGSDVDTEARSGGEDEDRECRDYLLHRFPNDFTDRRL